MPDLIQVADDLKSAPDQWLAQQMQSPSGTAPPWLIASEVQRRQKLRDGSSKGQAPQSSVSQDLIRSLYARIPPTAGLVPQGSGAPPGMPPVSLTPGNGATLGSSAPGAPPANFRMPPRTMAKGGKLDEEDDQDDNGIPDIYELPAQPSSRMELERLYPAIPPPAPETQPQTQQAQYGGPQIADPGTLTAGVIGSPNGPVGGGGGLAAVPGLMGGATPAAPAPPTPFSYPGFEPLPQPAPGSLGKDYRGKDIEVPQRPQYPMAAIAPVIQEHQSLEKQLANPIADFMDEKNTGRVKAWVQGIMGAEPDNKDLKDEMAFFKAQAAKAKPSLSGALLQLGTSLMASKEHNFGVALGQAGQKTLGWAEQQKNRALQLDMYRLKAATDLANRTQQYKQRVGADVVRGAEMLQARELAERQRIQTRYDASGNVIRQAEIGKANTDAAYQAKIDAIKANAATRHMTKEEAVTLVNSDDTDVAATARKVLDTLHAEEDRRTKAAAEITRETWDRQQKEREAEAAKQRTQNLENQKEMVRYRKNYADPKSTAKTKWDDTDTKNDANLFFQEQLDHVIKNPNGEGWIDETGKPVYMPSADPNNATLVTTPHQLHGVMRARAQKVLLDPNNWQEFPRFNNNPTERKRVAAAISRLPATSNVIATLSTGSRYKQPRGFADTGEVPAQDTQSQAPQPGQEQPQAQQPRAPGPAGSTPVSSYPTGVGVKGNGDYPSSGKNARGENKIYRFQDGQVYLLNP